MNHINVSQLVAQIRSWITEAISLALLLLIAAAVAAKYGFWLPYLPATDPVPLAYLAGAWWLYRGRS